MTAIVPEEAKSELGTIQIAPEVVEVIAGMAAIEMPGVADMSAGSSGGIAELLGRKHLSKGVKVSVGEKETAVDVSIVVEYGHHIPELAEAVQHNVKKAIESMTGLHVVEVNVHIHGVHFPSQAQLEEKPLQRVM